MGLGSSLRADGGVRDVGGHGAHIIAPWVIEAQDEAPRQRPLASVVPATYELRSAPHYLGEVPRILQPVSRPFFELGAAWHSRARGAACR